MKVHLHRAEWRKDETAIMSIRHEVFVIGQQVPAALERDGEDPKCHHVLALMDGEAVGTARMSGCGHIGRVSVLEAHRGQGIGRSLMYFLIEEARRLGLANVNLGSQVHALGFYESLGFEVSGGRYITAGIEHQHMILQFSGAR